MNVLVACEESQRVCAELRRLGHRAFSCDTQEQTGGHPEWHIQQDVIPLINGNCEFVTADGKKHKQYGKWDMIIAFPPCTYLTVTGNRWFNVDKYGDKARQRFKKRDKAIAFFMEFVNADCERIAIENPVGCMSKVYRKPDQIIQPWYFGDEAEKTTCLWLKGLSRLIPSVTDKPDMPRYCWVDKKTGRKRSQPLWYALSFFEKGSSPERSKVRSRTFPGVAKAMAEQWASGIINTKESYQLSFFEEQHT